MAKRQPMGPRGMASRGLMSTKQIARTAMPTPPQMRAAGRTGTLVNYSKMSPLDASGAGTAGMNINSNVRNTK